MAQRIVVFNRQVFLICLVGGTLALIALSASLLLSASGGWTSDVVFLLVLGVAAIGIGRRLVVEEDLLRVVEFLIRRRSYRFTDIERVDLVLRTGRTGQAKMVPARFVVRFRDGYAYSGFAIDRGFNDFLKLLRDRNIPISEVQAQR